MNYALMVSIGLIAVSCNAADIALSLENRVEEVTNLVRSGDCHAAAYLYDTELASTDLAPSSKIKVLTMIAGKHFENNRDDAGHRYAHLAAQAYASRSDDDLREAVRVTATSALRLLNRELAEVSKD